ncbi:2-hydroxymuconate tautomerase [Parasphingorhabdus sp.]|jgi:4-oxalocrotonate tautomerase|uniref:2-hydroxymuconate tautomerase n=1 Tax=Parasphingorhabdus sp. TaxID=2709688 RepID=UPI003A924149|tara:strand:- start:139 stop:339 length:201 start_codon:yes stop_codon:yes gene_type:complete
MPLARISLIEGTSDEQRRQLIAKVTDAFVESVGAPRELVRVLIDELPASNWGVGGRSFNDRAENGG